MNKIELSLIDEQVLVKEYRTYVLNETKSKLAFAIAVFAKKQRIINQAAIQSDDFIISGITVNNDLNPGARKTLLNILFSEKKKVEKAALIDYSKIGRKDSYKNSFSSFSMDLDSLVFIYKNLEVLITKRLTSPQINRTLVGLKGKLQSKQDQLVLNFIFNYPRYFHQTENNSTFFGLKLAKALNTNVCVYCNREYISTITNVKGKKVISPAFDHFLSQSEYPYLAISLFNLVPSCYSCNSQLKHDEKFNISDYLYPHETSYENIAQFKVHWKKTILISEISKDELINVDDLKITVESNCTTAEKKIFGDPMVQIKERKGNLNVFQTELVYDSIHKDSVHEIITQFRVHSKADVLSLITSYKFIKNDSDVYQFYFKNYLNEADFNKRPLARMTRDIATQMDRIYELNLTRH